jgi:DNA-binding response OmpR family regulator
MPGCSGPQLASELRQQLPQLLVLYMSGYVAESILGVESQTSGVAYIEKPFNPTSLVTKVGALLNARPQRGEST